MPCLLALLAIGSPRLVIVLLAVFSNYLGRAYDSAVVPFLGFLFLPLTTLAYAFAINTRGSIGGIYLILVVVALLSDLGLVGIGSRGRRRRLGRGS